MLTSGTIDEEIYDIIEAKRSVVDAAVEGGSVGNSDLSTKMIMGMLDKLF
jgi:SNF2 family DNA or RNA helicase